MFQTTYKIACCAAEKKTFSNPKYLLRQCTRSPWFTWTTTSRGSWKTCLCGSKATVQYARSFWKFYWEIRKDPSLKLKIDRVCKDLFDHYGPIFIFNVPGRASRVASLIWTFVIYSLLEVQLILSIQTADQPISHIVKLKPLSLYISFSQLSNSSLPLLEGVEQGVLKNQIFFEPCRLRTHCLYV